MSLPAWYLHKADQCARLAEATAQPGERPRFEAERELWLRLLAEEIGADEITLQAVLVRMSQ
jgi:hypothetical protein